MSKTIVALFNEKNAAENARQDLIRTGMKNEGINIEDNSNTALSSRFSSLREVGMPERHAEAYCEGLRRGGNLLIARVDDGDVARTQDILQRDGAINVEQRMAEWHKSGWKKFDANAKPFSATEASREREAFSRSENLGETFTIPVIEEEISIGKRQVETGGVRVREEVTERPVDEEVKLRDEHVKVDRKRVDRPMTDADSRSMKDQTIELTEKHEEPVIQKKTRVKEEVRLSKEQTERTEHVHDTVKRSDVKIDKINKDRVDRDKMDRRR